MQLTHKSIVKYGEEYREIFSNPENWDIRKLKKAINRRAAEIREEDDPLVPKGQSSSVESEFIGAAFEVFGEALVKYFGADRALDITDYGFLDTDNGVDAIAKDARTGVPVFIQYKGYQEHRFFEDTKTWGKNLLTAASLDTFVAEAYKTVIFKMPGMTIETAQKVRLVVITTASGLNRYTEEVKYEFHVKCIGVDGIDELTHGHQTFWSTLASSF